ncbi:Hypothetical predicted protein [Octopus vulgaris]|uniref:Uncharacterized protein n=1 Tax=Octopus vulgaris TaxID=6645 RepID=A0AA36ARY3_OCTVU|nr:Hypothetical predicted protein [Octopus vulgaris]
MKNYGYRTRDSLSQLKSNSLVNGLRFFRSLGNILNSSEIRNTENDDDNDHGNLTVPVTYFPHRPLHTPNI